jgi:hypothetical protein
MLTYIPVVNVTLSTPKSYTALKYSELGHIEYFRVLRTIYWHFLPFGTRRFFVTSGFSELFVNDLENVMSSGAFFLGAF